MTEDLVEKRTYPRVNADLRLNIARVGSVKSIDVGEGGLCFSSKETIASPNIPVEIRFPNGTPGLKTAGRVVWIRNLSKNGYLYGVEFTRLAKKERLILRKELIKTQINTLLDNIEDPEAKELIMHFFLIEILEYINEISKILQYVSEEEAYSFEIERILQRLNNKILLKGYTLELLLSDKAIIKTVKDNFRRLLRSWVYKSRLIKRGFDKPRGYCEDYRTLESIYDNKPISKDIGFYYDNIFLKSPYAVAVRNRKDRLKESVKELLSGPAASAIHILNLACGPCREIRELLPYLNSKRIIVFTCLDWDDEALQFSKDLLFHNAPSNVKFKFAKIRGANIERSRKNLQVYSRQNLIYSIGLMDYLPDRVLKRLIRTLYQYLEKNGQIILTHKNREKTIPPIFPDWFCDWTFVSRTRNEVINLFYDSGISGFSMSSESGAFGYIHYFTITKN